MQFATRLKFLRERQAETQETIAKLLMVSRATIAGYETKGKQPDYDKLIKLSKHFNISVDYLLGNSSCPEKYENIETESYIVLNRHSKRKIIKIFPHQQERFIKLIEAGFPELFQNINLETLEHKKNRI